MSRIVGFFTEEENKAAGVRSSVGECDKCGLYRKCNSPQMSLSGEGRMKTLIIGEAPGETEDEQGTQWVGKVGQLLRGKVARHKLDLDKDFWKINALGCRPSKDGKNRKPTKSEIKHCRPAVLKAIQDLKPLHIWLLGGVAVESLYEGRHSYKEISLWRGQCIPDPVHKAWVVPMFHPSYLSRNEKDEITQSVYDRDLTFAVRCLQYPERPEFINPYSKVVILTEYQKVIDLLDWIIANPPEWLDFDYETTGIKPFKAGHQIATISVSFDNGESAYAFPYQYKGWFTSEQQNEIQRRWFAILRNPDIHKAAHSMQFESLWSKWIVGTFPESLDWCTMNAAHVEDGRKKYNGLDVQAFFKFGIEGWDRDIAPFLKSRKGSEFNRVMEAPLPKLLMYNAIDSLVQGMLRVEQITHFTENPDKWQAFSTITMPGLHSLVRIQDNGINMDKVYYSREFLERHAELQALEAKILNSDEAQAFQTLTKEKYDFTPEHTRILLYDVLKVEKEKFTESGLESTEASVLASINNQTLKDIIVYRKLEKVRNTYIAQFLREIDDDSRMRPNYNMHKVQTYRSSSSNPNFQNVPNRDQEAKKISRSGVLPSKGNIILDWDYGAMEFKIASALCQDPVMVAYCHDPKTDIHRDTAGEVFAIDTKYVTKDMRFHTKNGMVFPTIYGSWYKNTARNIWTVAKDLPTGHPEKITVREYLYEVGVLKSLKSPEADFETHMKEVEREWWSKFKVLKQWQEKQWKNYIEKGYLTMPFGFHASGYLSRNDIINYPVQGSAFHCLIWSMNKIRQFMEDNRLLSLLIGQIHDNLIYDCCPDEKDFIVKTSTFFATENIRQENPWIIVPLVIEWEETDVDGSWYSKKDLAA